ncbi:MAG TPA: TonB-dependent receptor [Vicinamibacterales bacterium]|jgi:hypothetical protein
MFRLGSAVIGLIGMLAGSAVVLAQAGAVSGVVNDESGAAIPGASVSLVRQGDTASQNTISNRDGMFTFEDVSPATYVLKVRLSGFEEYQQVLTVGARAPMPLSITLRVASVDLEITVEADNDGELSTSSSSPATTRVDDEFLRALPLDSGDVMSVIGRFVSPAAYGATGPSIVVDGVQGDQLDLPSSAISRIRIDRNPYGALFQHPGGGRVEVSTARGHRSRYDGSVAISGRPSGLTARNAFAESDPESHRQLMQSNVGGALPGKRASFYLSAERFINDETAVVNAVTLSGPFVTNVPASQQRDSLFTRLQWWASPLQTVYITYAYGEQTFTNRESGGFYLPEHGLNGERRKQKSTLSYGALLLPTWQNNLLVTVAKEDDRTGQLASASAIVVDQAFTSGPAQTFRGGNRRTLDIEDTARFYGLAKHSVLFGARFRSDLNDAFDASNFGGTFEFGSLSQFAASTPLVFRVNHGDPNTAFDVYGVSGFVQDEIRVKPQLSVSAGLRYDWQSTADSVNNFGPRFAFVFAPDSAKKTVLRGGAGVFYDSVPRSVIERSQLFDGVRVSEVVISDPPFPDPFSTGQIVSPLPSIVRLAGDLESRSLSQASISVEREVWRRNWITAEYAFAYGAQLLRSRNINAPLPGTGERPNPDFLNINQIESTAFERSHSLTLTWRGRVANVFESYVQYVLASTTNDTSGAFSFPANNYDLWLERGPADFDRRHRFNVMANLVLPRGFQSGWVLSASSGAPFSVTTGFDDNGDTIANDRPAGVFRNSRRGPGTLQLDVRLAKSLDLARFLGGEHSGKRHRLDFAVDVFNALNTTNVTGVVGVLSSPFFGRGNSAAPARAVQFSARYSFRR